MAEAVHGAPSSRAWAVRILARAVSEREGAFVANPAGKVQAPCRYALSSALQAVGAESLDEALSIPHVGRDVRALVNANR